MRIDGSIRFEMKRLVQGLGRRRPVWSLMPIGGAA